MLKYPDLNGAKRCSMRGSPSDILSIKFLRPTFMGAAKKIDNTKTIARESMTTNKAVAAKKFWFTTVSVVLVVLLKFTPEPKDMPPPKKEAITHAKIALKYERDSTNLARVFNVFLSNIFIPPIHKLKAIILLFIKVFK